MAAGAADDALPVDVSDEPLIGWRCWSVLPHEGLLRPIYKRGLVWKPREAQEALCPEHTHEPPADNCMCGIWTVCHPLLLDEIGWTATPPKGISRLPGVMVVGEVSLWGKIIQHDRGWRASAAYPRHLYVFTQDGMLADTLRERYGVPVEWGPDAERLRRLLPVMADEASHAPQPDPTLRETLLDVLRSGLSPKALEELAAEAFDYWAKTWIHPPADRAAVRRVELAKVTTTEERRCIRYNLAVDSADLRALEGGSSLAARRALWVRLARWQRDRAEHLFDEKVEPALRWRDERLEELARGAQRNGRPYASSTMAYKRSLLKLAEEKLAALVPEIERLHGISIPTYREWCAITSGGMAASRRAAADPRLHQAWHRQAMAREARLVQLDHELAIKRHQLHEQQAALDRRRADQVEDRARIEAERTQLREEVVAGVERDRADLLREVGELELRRRAALALLPGPWPPPSARSPVAAGYPALALRLRELGITHTQVAKGADCSRAFVSHVLSGRVGVRGREGMLRTVTALIAVAEERIHAAAEQQSAPVEPAAVDSPSMHEDLIRERTELDKLRRRFALERAEIETARAGLRREVEKARREEDRSTTAQLARRVAEGLRLRLDQAGIEQQEVAQVAGLSASAVCRVLAGRSVSIRVVAAAERLLNKGRARESM